MSMDWKPYDHQRDGLKQLSLVRRNGGNRALVVMASGLGKTVLAAFEVARYRKRYGGRVLFLCHQNDILEQAHWTFSEIVRPYASYGYMNGYVKDLDADIVFATFQTMVEWADEFAPDDFAYIVVDESHHSKAETYLPTLEYFKPDFLLGITATPNRRDLQDIREIYGNEVYSLPLADALAQDLLASVDYRLMTDYVGNLEVLKTPVGRLSIKQLNRQIFIPRRDEEIVRIIVDKAGEFKNPRIMIFSPSISHCDRLEELIPGAVAIHSDLPDSEQTRRLDAFRKGLVSGVITVDKFNEGIDVPDVNMVVFLRQTSSRTVFYQQLGRGLRKSDDKDKVLVLDFVGNCQRLQMVYKLWVSVAEKKNQLRKYRYLEEPIVVHNGGFQFNETAVEIIEVLKGVQTGYTKEMLIGQLRSLAATLGRIPIADDIHTASEQGLMASVATYRHYFETLHKARVAAGLVGKGEKSRYKRSEEEMLQELKDLAQKIGHSPNIRELSAAYLEGKCAHPATYRSKFGSLEEAFKMIGLAPQRKFRPRRYSDSELVEQLRTYTKMLGRLPYSHELDSGSTQDLCPSYWTYRKRYHSLKGAFIAAGLINEENE